MTKDQAAFYYSAPIRYSDIICDRHRCKFPSGHWTDDTSQMICIMQSMLKNNGNLLPTDLAHNLTHWANHGFPQFGETRGWGIGSNTR
eukprot:TRINITY_DN4691_c0_g1_i1.p1 TRINITY_DN4691_c0_g1~~TRINITY_DN4691_c0_g1_i1.p1  ORF type:complete len:88 (-),score=8.17 TRINITY_DN4691_c0_g1_i1:190-453(-)